MNNHKIIARYNIAVHGAWVLLVDADCRCSSIQCNYGINIRLWQCMMVFSAVSKCSVR